MASDASDADDDDDDGVKFSDDSSLDDDDENPDGVDSSQRSKPPWPEGMRYLLSTNLLGQKALETKNIGQWYSLACHLALVSVSIAENASTKKVDEMAAMMERVVPQHLTVLWNTYKSRMPANTRVEDLLEKHKKKGKESLGSNMIRRAKDARRECIKLQVVNWGRVRGTGPLPSGVQ